jgi:precorrin-2/cobalt-factor-2 C20-methyltransferase
VAFITTGDAMLYSTFLHVWEVVREMEPNAPVRVIPGVSSINAASALTGVALGQGDERVAIVPATWHENRLRELLDDTDTVVLMKVARVLPQVIDLLAKTDRLSQAVLVSRGTAEQQIVTRDLERFRDRRLNYLTLVIVARSRPFLERLRSEAESDARFAVNRQGEST